MHLAGGIAATIGNAHAVEDMTIRTNPAIYVQLAAHDQLGVERPAGSLGEIGAIEIP